MLRRLMQGLFGHVHEYLKELEGRNGHEICYFIEPIQHAFKMGTDLYFTDE
jgi:hypothetical protein